MSLRTILEQGIARSSAFSDRIALNRQVFQDSQILDRLTLEVARLRDEQVRLATEVPAMQEQLDKEQAECSVLRRHCKSLCDLLQKAAKEREELARQSDEWEATHGSIDSLLEEIARVERERDDLNARHKSLSEEKQRLEEKLRDLEQDIRPFREMDEQVAVLRKKIERIEQGATRQELAEELDALQRKIQTHLPDL